jgi:hypothetical protein
MDVSYNLINFSNTPWNSVRGKQRIDSHQPKVRSLRIHSETVLQGGQEWLNERRATSCGWKDRRLCREVPNARRHDMQECGRRHAPRTDPAAADRDPIVAEAVWFWGEITYL